MALSDSSMPLGYSEAAYSLPESLPKPTKELLRFLTKNRGLDTLCAEVANGRTSLGGIYNKAVKAGIATVGPLDALPDSEFKRQKFARPPGYSAQTLLHFGRLAVMGLLDYGATCSGMPEEVALTIISHALGAVEDGQYTRNDNEYPLVRMHKYDVPPTIDGVAAGKSIEIRYALVLRCEFVPVGKERGPFRDLYFKVFPRGTCNIPGCIIGFSFLRYTGSRSWESAYRGSSWVAEPSTRQHSLSTRRPEDPSALLLANSTSSSPKLTACS